METRAESKDSKGHNHKVNLITHVAVEPAHASASHAVIPAIKDTVRKELAPKTTLADTSYGSDANVQAAAEMGVELAPPSADKDPELGQVRLAEFQTD
jgi:hypothetical protein